ncbi:hypothetical protein LEP1GSC034_4444 [Leptospira interrogans str. 2003000735]|uniref:S1/P1 Nuclease n=3 Tax=Leptospira interrogans TaxID=173 RepID=A0AAP9WFJ0_LEPIR|nr:MULTISPECIES: hypothetical protein [Leptospira]EMY06046.1 hypothetical protein LEP1GSC029_3098 [Leptospira interrogans str. 2002000626]EMY27409.1 hypothetical protein LEP1GSC115_0338 [Leptospira interrogans serovar Australis str. 200703203]EJP02038.1 hypothetical protein LEP1GSC007_3552 [Leptospira interrogans serovar Bulgarica str. Mallika]EJP14297.1 hypothetical protein LEP1GSC080_4574 [Leptospira interrogans str. FPW2026]EKN89910.1 hypothetical protein LEP1GSC027_3907 [Leptospira interro
MSWKKLVLYVSIFSILLCHGLNAYQEDGHFYTVQTVLNNFQTSSPLTKEETALVAFCTQLPDEVPELDAISVYQKFALKYPLDYTRWVFTDQGSSEILGRMAEVQQLLHGLTGGNSEHLRNVAIVTLDRLRTELTSKNEKSPEKLCALGFAFHLLGDSFAHRKLLNSKKMYPTGRGHASDMTLPDHPVYNDDRVLEWEKYAKGIPSLFRSDLKEIVIKDDFQKARKLTGNNYPWHCIFGRKCEDKLRRILLHRLRESDSFPRYNPIQKDRYPAVNCQEYVQRVVEQKDIPFTPDCGKSWKIYKQVSLDVWKRLGYFQDENSRKQIQLYDGDDLWQNL